LANLFTQKRELTSTNENKKFWKKPHVLAVNSYKTEQIEADDNNWIIWDSVLGFCFVNIKIIKASIKP